MYDFFANPQRSGKSAVDVQQSHRAVFRHVVRELNQISFTQDEWVMGEVVGSGSGRGEWGTCLELYALQYWWKHLEGFQGEGEKEGRAREKLLRDEEWRKFVRSQQGRYALISAVLNGWETAVEILLESGGAELYNEAETERQTPSGLVYESSRRGYGQICKKLVELGGANVNQRGFTPSWEKKAGEHEMTALHIAARNGDVATVKILVELGADQAAKDAIGQTAFFDSSKAAREYFQRLELEKWKHGFVQRAVSVVSTCLILNI